MYLIPSQSSGRAHPGVACSGHKTQIWRFLTRFYNFIDAIIQTYLGADKFQVIFGRFSAASVFFGWACFCS